MKLNKAAILLSMLMSSAAIADDSHYDQALTAYHQNEIEAAYIHLKNALQENPKSLHARLLFADILIAKGQYEEAEFELSEALNLGADVNLVVEPMTEALLSAGRFTKTLFVFEKYTLNAQSDYHYQLAKGTAYVGLEDYQGAFAVYDAMVDKYPDDPEVLLGIASVYLSTGELDKAEKQLDSLKPRSSENEKISRYLGSLAYERGELDLALTYYQRANQLEPENVQTISGLVNTYMSLEEYKEAKLWIDKLIVITPYDPRVRLLNAMALLQNNEEKAANDLLKSLTEQLSNVDQAFMLSQPQLLLVDALASYGQKNWEQARNKFRTYIKQLQGEVDVRAVVLLADVYNKQDQPQQALKLLARYEDELIQNRDFALLLAGTYIKYNRKFDANKLLNQMRELYAEDTGVLLMSAHLLSSKGEARQAIEMLTSADIPQNNNFKHTLAALYLNTGDFNASLKLSSELVKAEPDNSEFRLLNIKSLIGTGNIDQAEAALRDLYRVHKDMPEVQFEYARLLYNKGLPEEAEKELLQLTNAYADEGIYWIALAEVEYSLGEIASAVKHLQRLTSDSDYQIRALKKLANIYVQHNKFDQALDTTNALLRLDPVDTDAMYLKARALTGLNRTEMAKKQCDKLFSWWLEDASGLIKLSKLQIKLGFPEDASESLLQALENEPANQPALFSLIKLDIRQGKFEDAALRINRLEKSERYDPVMVTNLKGDLELAKENTEGAFYLYSQVLKQDSANAIAFMNLYRMSRNEIYADRFAVLGEETVNSQPDRPFFRAKLADHLMWMENFSAAKHHYQVLLTRKIPKFEMALALNNLAVINITEENLDQALQMSQQAVNLFPMVPAIVDTAGWALTKAGQPEKGLSYLRQAYSMDASEPEIIYHLAYTLSELNKVTEAKLMIEKLIALPMDNKFRKEVERLNK